MPYVAGPVLVGFLVSVLWPYILILAGIGAIVGWMVEHPIIGITIVVSIDCLAWISQTRAVHRG